MPYITKEAREELYDRDPENAGELQYLIAMMMSDYISDKDQYDYQTLNDVMGALAGAQQEFYRKIVAPYEERKELLNGSVY